MKVRVTIGLCVKNAANVVQTALDSISIQDYPHELLKLVIVDDGSSDNTLSIVRKFAQETDIPTIVTSSQGKGLGVTRQIVVDNAEGDYIFWEDDDLVLPNDIVRNHVEFMEQNPDVGAAKCVYDEFSTQPILRIVDFAFLLPDHQPLKQIGTGAAIFRLKALRNVGGFDVRVKGAGEDLDISRRLRAAGWTLAANKSARTHHKNNPVTLKDFWKKNSWWGYGNHLIFHKHNDKQFLLEYFPIYLLMSVLKTTLKIYRLTRIKKAFFFFFFGTFGIMAQSVGFVRAHLDGYGHFK